MEQNDWIKNEKLSHIAPAKLQLLLSLLEQSKTKKQSELLPFLMAVSSQAKAAGVTFSLEEINAIIDVLKTGKSKEDIERIDAFKKRLKI